MSNYKNKSKNLSIIIVSLITATLITSFLFLRDMNTLNKAYDDMNRIEFIGSSTQRLISLAQSSQLQQKDIFFIADSTKNTLTPNGSTALSILTDVEMVLLANDVVSNWQQLEKLVEDSSLNLIDLALARDAHFYAMTDLSMGISDYTRELNDTISVYQGIILFLFFTMALIILNNLLRTHTELRQSQELAKTAQIDLATGLYNRSRCQELFKNNQKPSTKKQPAILVLDLNDLKKTNDSLGHRVGDELIQSFAHVLKDACAVHIIPPFLGRYGGDEFIIYYDDIRDESEVRMYLKELTFLTEQFNANESRFQISYAAGYACIFHNSAERLTIRQLFDKADSAMYENKIAEKRKKNPNYDQEVREGNI